MLTIAVSKSSFQGDFTVALVLLDWELEHAPSPAHPAAHPEFVNGHLSL